MAPARNRRRAALPEPIDKRIPKTNELTFDLIDLLLEVSRFQICRMRDLVGGFLAKF
jgi:hypothetical protein